jgi:hypothetical protein
VRQRTGATRLGDDRGGQLGADAGDLIEPRDRGLDDRAVALAGAGPGAGVVIDAPGGADHGELLADQHRGPGDVLVQKGDLVQQHLRDLAVVAGEHPVQRLGQRGVLGFHPAPGQAGQRLRVALPGDQRGDHVLRGQRGQRGGHRRHLDHGVFQQLLQPLPAPGPVLGQMGAGPGVVPQHPDLGRRHETGPQQPLLGQPGQPHRVQLAGLGPPGQLLNLAGGHQLHIQPGRLQHVKPDPPVIAGRLQGHLLHARVRQRGAERTDRGHRGRHRPHGGLPAAGPRPVRLPQAHHAIFPGHIHRGDRLENPLVFLIIDNLRHTHRCLLSLSRWVNPAGCPGAPVRANAGILTVVLEAT